MSVQCLNRSFAKRSNAGWARPGSAKTVACLTSAKSRCGVAPPLARLGHIVVTANEKGPHALIRQALKLRRRPDHLRRPRVGPVKQVPAVNVDLRAHLQRVIHGLLPALP